MCNFLVIIVHDILQKAFGNIFTSGGLALRYSDQPADRIERILSHISEEKVLLNRYSSIISLMPVIKKVCFEMFILLEIFWAR